MAKNNVTLKQIAQKAGVSTTTVHRVLNDKEGCGEELKAEILRIAHELGYSVNISASSLRKKTSQVALVFPSGNSFSRFFMDNILAGYRRCQEDLTPCNVQFHEYYYDYDDPDTMCPILQRICQDDPVKFDGLVLWGNTTGNRVIALLNRIRGKDIPLVMLERAPADTDLYSCCVGPDDQLVGTIAGELLAKLTHTPGKVLIVTQKLGYEDPNGTACVRKLQALGRTDLKPVVFPLPMQNHIYTQEIRQMLERNPDITAVYTTCARHTLGYIQAAEALGFHPCAAVGSEIFAESSAALENGVLSAVVNKCPQTMGYQALQMLFDQIVRNEPMGKEFRVMPLIVLDANRSACENH